MLEAISKNKKGLITECETTKKLQYQKQHKRENRNDPNC